MVKLPYRLQVIANLINNNSIIADVGTDHALLPIYLIQTKKAKFVYAVDNKIEPLKIAQINIQKTQCGSRIKLMQSSGLLALNQSIDTVVISGLGTGTIMTILQNDSVLIKRYILLPHNHDNRQIRHWVQAHKFFIPYESVIKDHNHFYELIVIDKKTGYHVINDIDIWFGPVLSREQNIFFVEKWVNRQIYLKSLLQKTNIKKKQKDVWLQELHLITKVLQNTKIKL